MQDVYATVASNTSLKIFLTLVAILDLECNQYDIITAFLNASIADGVNIYVRQLEGFEDGTSRVCRLRRALYGLRRSPLWWYQTVTQVLVELGFQPLASELCLFKNEQTSALLLLYVDDFCIAAPTQDDIQKAYSLLKDHFDVKELGLVRQFLGFTIIRNRPQH
jgi:hypothetical protein